MSSDSNSSLLDSPQSQPGRFAFAVVALYALTVPVVKFLIKPSGLIADFVVSPLCYVAGVDKDPFKFIVALTTFHLFAVYIVSGAMSAIGQQIGNKRGYRNKEPRLYRQHLGSGIAHRMVSTHDALYDVFPAYAVTAALLAFSAPRTLNTPPINALTLHVFLKIFVYSPAYVMNVDVLRSMSHLGSMTALVMALVEIMI